MTFWREKRVNCTSSWFVELNVEHFSQLNSPSGDNRQKKLFFKIDVKCTSPTLSLKNIVLEKLQLLVKNI